MKLIRYSHRIMQTISAFNYTTKYINYKEGPPQGMFVDQRQIKLQPNQYLMKVKAIGINRAECLQRAGKYASSKPIESFLGLEASGEIYQQLSGQKLFDGCALLSGGSYSELVAVPKQHVLKLPSCFDYVKGAALPEAWLTAYQLIRISKVQKGQSLLIYAGASGVGTAALQICTILGIQGYVVVSTQQKAQFCLKLGAKGAVTYKDNENWEKELLKERDGQLFEGVMDCVGTSYLKKTIDLLSVDGNWVLYGLLSGNPKVEINMAKLLSKRITLSCSLLKSRSHEYKSQLIRSFQQFVLPSLQSGKAKPVIYEVLKNNWESAEVFIEAQKLMESNKNMGKIIVDNIV